VEDEGIAAMLTTPDSIRTLQRKLYRKAKQEPAFRFYALYDKVYRADILNHAYHRVRANKGGAGIDGVTFKAVESGEGVSAFLTKLKQALEDKSYVPSPVKRVMIPKQDGSKRALGIPTIRDRVAQMAAKLVIEPIFEADFCNTSYGFRPKRSAHDAVDDISIALNCGYTRVIDADISKYFDTIAHAKLMSAVAERIADGAVLHLIKMWLKAPVVEEDEDGTERNSGGGKANRQGTPQGGVISPLLSNLYLHQLDRLWCRGQLQKHLQARLVRYADDFVVLCRKGTRRPLAVVRQVLEQLGLRLNERKSQVVDARQAGFDFLGFELRMLKSERTGGCYAHVQPSRKSLQQIKDRITALTDRRMSLLPLPLIIKRVNMALEGWVGYFHFRNCSRSMLKLKVHAEQRVQIHLGRRHKRRGIMASYRSFPCRSLYKKFELYKVPTTAGWTGAHALR
jgi:group II intron reverse transcriptase/maturase